MMANERDTTPVTVTLDRKRPYRANDTDRSAVWVGPGEVQVPRWVADEWAKPRHTSAEETELDMASSQEKTKRRTEVLERLATALDIKPADLHAHAKGDPGLAIILTLERVANAVEQIKPAVPGDALRAAILASSDEELTTIPGVGEKSIDQLREWAKTPPQEPPVVVETVKVEPLKTVETVEVVEADSKPKGKTK